MRLLALLSLCSILAGVAPAAGAGSAPVRVAAGTGDNLTIVVSDGGKGVIGLAVFMTPAWCATVEPLDAGGHRIHVESVFRGAAEAVVVDQPGQSDLIALGHSDVDCSTESVAGFRPVAIGDFVVVS